MNLLNEFSVISPTNCIVPTALPVISTAVFQINASLQIRSVTELSIVQIVATKKLAVNINMNKYNFTNT